MCQILLDDRRFRVEIDRSNRWKQTTLHYAATGGFIRTIGKLLLHHCAQFPGYGDSEPPSMDLINDPARLLCMQFRYHDAWWLLEYCKQNRANNQVRTTQLYTRILAALCVLRKPAVYSRLSLRDQQDRLYRSANDQTFRRLVAFQDVPASKNQRLWLTRVLLDLGADPNSLEATDPTTMPITAKLNQRPGQCHRTTLKLALMSEFTDMVDLILLYRPNCNIDSLGLLVQPAAKSYL